MVGSKNIYTAVERKRVGSFAACQKQGESYRLSVRISKLTVRRLREEELSPVFR
ncbi:MAG: hypothetical protein JOZ29_13415 [Deltaproteobacteria bacterium]|nr:hypothetical protein [Deltaproteobacteria bacterium]